MKGEEVSDYKIGTEVRAIKDIWREADDYGPQRCLALVGEQLIVRNVEHCWPVYVSHPDVIDQDFGVQLDEIEIIKTGTTV